MEDKRKRTVNFTSDEKSVLTELVMNYKDSIENKKTDASTNAEKARGWKLLCEQFNAVSTYCTRTPESLKTCWENIKRQTKKQSANRKRELFKTGGGRPPPPPPSTGADRIVESILGPALEGLENVYDSDALLINGKDKETTQLTTGKYFDMGSDDTEMGAENEVVHSLIVEDDPPTAGTSWSKQDKKHMIEQHTTINTSQSQPQVYEDNDNNLKWEGWTPNSLKRPISEVLKTANIENKENTGWLKRRRPKAIDRNLSDQLTQEKINLVKTLIENARDESKKKLLILDEQLKQEKIKTQKLL